MIAEQKRSEAAKERLWRLRDGAGSRLIALKRRQALLEQFYELKIEAGIRITDADLAVQQLIEEMRADRIAVEHEIDAAYHELEDDAKGAR